MDIYIYIGIELGALLLLIVIVVPVGISLYCCWRNRQIVNPQLRMHYEQVDGGRDDDHEVEVPMHPGEGELLPAAHDVQVEDERRDN